jgi:hypothetical protein
MKLIEAILPHLLFGMNKLISLKTLTNQNFVKAEIEDMNFGECLLPVSRETFVFSLPTSKHNDYNIGLQNYTSAYIFMGVKSEHWLRALENRVLRKTFGT